MDNGSLMLSGVLGSMCALVVVPRLYAAVTRRSPWSPALLRRVEAALERWTEVLAHDWAMLLGRIRDIAQHTTEEPRGAHRFVLGMIALLVGPVVLILNAVILAQIFEIFLPGSAETLAIPYLGEFMPFPFIAAIIIAGVEVIAAIALWHAPHLAWRLFAGVVALTAVAAETAGGYIRARVLEGTDDLARLGTSGLLGAQTAGVSAIISFLAPTAEMIAGVLLFDGVLVPLGHHGLRLVRIIPLWVLRGVGYLLYGPFLRAPYLLEHVVELPEDQTEEAEEIAPPAPLIHTSIQEADVVAEGMVDEAVALKTEAHALAVAIAGLLGGIATFMATKVKHGPQHLLEVHPGTIVAEFTRTLTEARSQPVFLECQTLAGEATPRHPARVYARYSREMLLEEVDALDRKRTRLHLLVRQIAQGALSVAVGQLDRIRQTDALLWSQDPEAKVEWEGIQALARTLETQAQHIERRLLHTITHRQETLQGLNDLVASPLLAEMRERSHAENLRQIKRIATRLGCDTVREGFPRLAALFAESPEEEAERAIASVSPLAGRWRDSREVPGLGLLRLPDEETADMLDGREAVRLLLERARTELAACQTRLEQANDRMHEVTDQLVEVRCLECPEMLCAVCPRCEHLKLTMQAQAAEVDEDCVGFARMLTVRIGQLQRLVKRKTLWGRLLVRLDEWREGDDPERSRREVRR